MQNPIELIAFTYPHEAHMAKTVLEKEGIETFLKDELTSQVTNLYSDAFGGIKILVDETDLGRGRDILVEGGFIVDNQTNKTSVEKVSSSEHIDQNICPFCKSKNIGKADRKSVV